MVAVGLRVVGMLVVSVVVGIGLGAGGNGGLGSQAPSRPAASTVLEIMRVACSQPLEGVLAPGFINGHPLHGSPLRAGARPATPGKRPCGFSGDVIVDRSPRSRQSPTSRLMAASMVRPDHLVVDETVGRFPPTGELGMPAGGHCSSRCLCCGRAFVHRVAWGVTVSTGSQFALAWSSRM